MSLEINEIFTICSMKFYHCFNQVKYFYRFIEKVFKNYHMFLSLKFFYNFLSNEIINKSIVFE